jgi:hypothetical protein
MTGHNKLKTAHLLIAAYLAKSATEQETLEAARFVLGCHEPTEQPKERLSESDLERTFDELEQARRKNIELEAAYKRLADEVNNRPHIQIAADLHPDSRNALIEFSKALAEKMAANEIKYRFGNSWKTLNWRQQLIEELYNHIAKGDPRDIAIYAMFAWARAWNLDDGPVTYLKDLLKAKQANLEFANKDVQAWEDMAFGLGVMAQSEGPEGVVELVQALRNRIAQLENESQQARVAEVSAELASNGGAVSMPEFEPMDTKLPGEWQARVDKAAHLLRNTESAKLVRLCQLVLGDPYEPKDRKTLVGYLQTVFGNNLVISKGKKHNDPVFLSLSNEPSSETVEAVARAAESSHTDVKSKSSVKSDLIPLSDLYEAYPRLKRLEEEITEALGFSEDIRKRTITAIYGEVERNNNLTRNVILSAKNRLTQLVDSLS